MNNAPKFYVNTSDKGYRFIKTRYILQFEVGILKTFVEQP